MNAAMSKTASSAKHQPLSRGERRKSFYVLIMMIASFGLSVVSFYTTFYGFANFLNFGFAFPTTFAVQALMLLAAWQLGYALVGGQGVRIGRLIGFMLIFVICFGLSTFFSFSKLFDQVAGADHRHRTQTAQLLSFYDEARSRLQESLDVQIKATGEEALASEGFLAWKQGIDGAIDLIAAAPSEVRKARDAATQERTEATQRARVLDAEIELAGKRVERLRDDLDRLTRRFDTVQKQVDTFRAQREFYDNEMKAQLKGVDGRPAGIGPKYRDAEAKRDEAIDKLPSLEGELTNLRVARDSVKANYDDAQTALSELQGERSKLEPRLAQSAGAANATNVLIDGDVAEDIRSAVEDFRVTYDQSHLERAIARCEAFKTSLAGIPTTKARANSIVCANPALFSAIDKVKATTDAKANFGTECPAAPPQAAPVADGAAPDPSAQANAVLAAIRQCVAASAAPVELRRDVNTRLEAFAIAMDGGVQKFSSVLNAITSGNQDATLAFGVAVVIDLLVLICGLVGASASTVETEKNRRTRDGRQLADRVRKAVQLGERGGDDDTQNAGEALKLILRSIARDEGGWFAKGKVCEVVGGDGEPMEVIEHARRILRHLTGAGLARQHKALIEDAPTFVLTDDVIEELGALASSDAVRKPMNNIYEIRSEDDFPAQSPT